MNTEVIKEIANQLGIAASAITKDVIPSYASYVIAVRISNIIVLAFITIALLALARFFISKSKEYVNWEHEKLTPYRRSDMKDKYETFEMVGYICYTVSAITVVILMLQLAIIIPWIASPYGAFINLLMPH